MIGLLWRVLWAWRAWRAIGRNRNASRLLRKGWDLHANRWVPRPERTAERLLPIPGTSGGLGGPSMAWVEAEAAMPLGWRLMALVRQPDSDDWLATAAGPLDGQTVHGRGGQPDRALHRLAEELRRINGPMTG
jgi:hypothetical protein